MDLPRFSGHAFKMLVTQRDYIWRFNVQQYLSDEWRKSGVQEGDLLLVHSNITRTIRRYLKSGIKISAQDILDSFLKAIGPSGTLLLPLFNFDFTKGVPFNFMTTPSHMGALTEAGRLHPLGIRTGHPIYSFVAIGRLSEAFKGVNNYSGYGNDSPFAILNDMDGKIAVLDLPDQHSMTFYHYIEEMHEVTYRYHKKFTSNYTDQLGNTELRTYGLFVRDIEEGVITHVDPAGELMWRNGLYSGHRPNEESGLRTISARKMYDFISDLIISGKAENNLYRIHGDSNV